MALGLSTPARAAITDGKYCGPQVFDCQRSPAFPTGGQSFTASGFKLPIKSGSGSYTLGAGEYIKFFYPGGTCSGGQVGIQRYDASDVLIDTIAAGGSVYGLDTLGFLHTSNPGGTGTFVANSAGYSIGGSVTYTPAEGLADCAALEAYAGSPICFDAPDSEQTPTPTASPTPSPTPAPCLESPRGDCLTTANASLKIHGSANGAQQRLRWAWEKGTTSGSQFGDPVGSDTSYHLCVYDDGALVMNPGIDAGGTCNGKACWRSSSRGLRLLKYKNRAGNGEGITLVKFKEGSGKAQVWVAGRGANLDLPLPLADTTAVTVQLVRDDGGPCWSSTLPAPPQFNKPNKFRDKIK